MTTVCYGILQTTLQVRCISLNRHVYVRKAADYLLLLVSLQTNKYSIPAKEIFKEATAEKRLCWKGMTFVWTGLFG